MAPTLLAARFNGPSESDIRIITIVLGSVGGIALVCMLAYLVIKYQRRKANSAAMDAPYKASLASSSDEGGMAYNPRAKGHLRGAPTMDDGFEYQPPSFGAR